MTSFPGSLFPNPMDIIALPDLPKFIHAYPAIMNIAGPQSMASAIVLRYLRISLHALWICAFDFDFDDINIILQLTKSPFLYLLTLADISV